MSATSDQRPRLTLVLGHAASGKSAWAERAVTACPGPWTYVATGAAGDGEMADRIAAHAARRGPGWRLTEEPLDLAGACAAARGPVLVDCATMWLSNLAMDGAAWDTRADDWIAAMRANPDSRFWVVSNDVGGGVVPANAMARQFQRDQGMLNQRLAAAADRVVLVTAGLPQVLK